MSKKECPSCAMEINQKDKICPVCGFEFPHEKPTVNWMALALLIMFLIYFLFKLFS